MPTYYCTTLEGRLTAEQKSGIAGEITRVHCEVTGAPSFFAQVIFREVKPGNYFMGGAPLKHDQLFIYGHIRSGRAAVDKADGHADEEQRERKQPTALDQLERPEPARRLVAGQLCVPMPGQALSNEI